MKNVLVAAGVALLAAWVALRVRAGRHAGRAAVWAAQTDDLRGEA